MCGCECCVSAKIINSSLLSWNDSYLRNLKDISKNSQNRRSDKMANPLFDTYKNSMMPYGHHMYVT